MAKISQRVAALEAADVARKNAYAAEYPGGVHIDTITVSNTEWFIIKTARALGCGVVVVPENNSKIRVYGVRR